MPDQRRTENWSAVVDLDALVKALTNVDSLLELLPPEEVAEYKRCQQSVIDARRHGERIAHEIWIG